jgi:hypothetical protein
MKNKPTLALIASYNDDSCGIAGLARLLNKVLSVHFTVKVFSLDSKLMKNHNFDNEAEIYINNIAKEIQNFDYVNIHQEIGLCGTTIEACKRRIINLCNASKNLIYTLHSIQINDGSDFANAYKDIMEVL